MRINKLFGKCLAIGIIFSFFLMTSISVIGESNSPLPLNMDPGEPIPKYYGQQGENGWFIGDVTVYFNYDPKIVDEIYYNLDDEWQLFTGPFSVVDEGIQIIEWYWIDEDGNQHDEFPITFRIDQTPPTISIQKEIQQNNKVKFIITGNDDVSDVNRVEFYLDEEIVTTQTEKPYEYLYSPDGSGTHYVYAICYNFAGLSEQSETLDTKERSRNVDFPILNIFFQRIYYIIYLIQQFFLI